MNERLRREAIELVGNLRNGIRLLAFRRVSLDGFYVSIDQAVLLVLAFATITFVGSFLLSLPKPEISIYGLTNVATQSFFILFAVYILSKISEKDGLILPLLIVLLSLWPWFYVGWLVLGKSSNFTYWQFYGNSGYQYLLYNIWMAAVVVSAVSKIVGRDSGTVLKVLGIYLAIVVIPVQFQAFGAFWNPAHDFDSRYAKYMSINEEDTYFKQFEFIKNIKANMLPERSGVSDIYFVGFGGYSSQDVFMKEVQYAKEMFDDRFDTKGRSVALINNIKTMDETPLALKSNLDLLLAHIGNLVNPSEDILFLYLTSHGSKKQGLSVQFMPLRPNKLRPSDLRKSLDKSGIQYRVLLISACYSGGFIEPLKNDYTVVFTASALNKKSFGCGNKSKFTYFGKAIFEEQLRHSFNFIDAFKKAILSIQRREQEQKFEHSSPQLFVGHKIREKLEKVSQELEAFNKERILLSERSGDQK